MRFGAKRRQREREELRAVVAETLATADPSSKQERHNSAGLIPQSALRFPIRITQAAAPYPVTRTGTSLRKTWLSGSKRRWLAAVGAGTGLLLVIGYLVFEGIPDLFAPTEGLNPEGQAKAIHDVRTTALQLLGGTVLVVGAVLSALTLRTNREGQITERFTRAIDQLGSQELDVRVGGIYGLERIARDSREDHGPVMEVLTAYVPEHAPWPPGRGAPESSEAEAAIKAANVPRTEEDGGWPRRPATDVQAALTVVGRRNLNHEKGADRELALIRTNLPGADLRGAHLEAVYFSGAHLEGAYFSGAHLEGAYFSGAHLEGAYFNHAHLEGAYFNDAHLEGAMLRNAHLEGANLIRAQLKGAEFGGTLVFDGEGVLTGGEDGAHLKGALLMGAHLEDAELPGANLERAALHGADLYRAFLAGADLRRADLAEAHLEGAKLQGATFEGAVLHGATYDSETTWPEGFDAEARGATTTD